MKSTLGRMPYVDIIWKRVHSNAERKTLKLVCKSFWDCHVADKYKNNYSETQKLAMEHVYCKGDCPNSERFKVCTLNILKLMNIIFKILIFRTHSIHHWSLLTKARLSIQMKKPDEKTQITTSTLRSNRFKKQSGEDANHAGKSLLLHTLSIK